MFKTLLQTIQLQACHCKTNWRSYLKILLFVPVFYIIIFCGFIFFYVKFVDQRFASAGNGDALIFFSAIPLLFLLSKLTINVIRLISLDEKPKHIISLKYSKQAFLYISYTFLISSIVMLFQAFLLYLIYWFIPFDYSTLNPLAAQSNAITNSLVNTFNQSGMQVNTDVSHLSAYSIASISYLISASVIFSLFVFNTFAVASDINIPFYRHILHLKKFFFVNYLLVVLSLILSMVYYKITLYFTPNLIWHVAIFFIQIYSEIFIMLCLVQSFNLWQKNLRLEK